jgi:hypothetical protein
MRGLETNSGQDCRKIALERDMQCHLVRIDQIPVGTQALRLFVVDDELNAGIIDHRPDGRVIVSFAKQRGVDGIVPTISQLLVRQPNRLYVVLENDAFLPETFPKINSFYQ